MSSSNPLPPLVIVLREKCEQIQRDWITPPQWMRVVSEVQLDLLYRMAKAAEELL